MNSDGWSPPSPKPNSMLAIARSMRVAWRSENTSSPPPSMRLMNSWMLSPSMDARNPSPNFCISFCAVTSPMVGMHFRALSTTEDWSQPDRQRERISVLRGAAQAPLLHCLRYSSAWRSTGLTGSPSRSVMTVPQSGQAATLPWRVHRPAKTSFQREPIRIPKPQRAAVAFGVEHGGRGDADGRLAAAHLAIDDRGALATVDQQFGGGVDDFGLGLEQLALEAGDDELPVRLRLARVDRRIGAVEGVEQFVAELADEILKAQGQRGRLRVQQLALYGLGVGGGGFEISGHGDAPKKMGHAPTPAGRWHAPWWEEESARGRQKRKAQALAACWWDGLSFRAAARCGWRCDPPR